MYKTIKQVKAAYLKELRSYKNWLNKTIARYHGSKDAMAMWDDGDYNKATSWSSALDRIESVLGITKKESDTFQKQIGLIKEKKETDKKPEVTETPKSDIPIADSSKECMKEEKCDKNVFKKYS